MEIICTVKEFAEMVRSCARGSSCVQCALHEVCDGEGVEQFVPADNILDNPKEGNR